MSKSEGPAPLIEEPVLLVGTTRSGTTLLSLMLDHHPAISFAGEFEWVWDFMPGVAAPPLEDYYAWLRTNRHFLHHGLEIDRSLDFAGQARRFLADMRVQKDPGLVSSRVGVQVHRHYTLANQVWPRARFIHIVRDGRDVAASWIKFGWLGNAYVAAQRWNAALIEWDHAKKDIEEERRIELRFEDLIADPTGQLARLTEFLGVDYDEAMLRYHEDTTYSPVDSGQGGKWRKSLTPRDLALFERFSGHQLERHGYALSGAPTYDDKPWSPALLELDDRVRHNRARIRNLGPGLWLAEHLSRRLRSRTLRDAVATRVNALENARIQ
ncbi:MAG: sulfotransferase [Myxococcales bacterium]|nr:sulfotransferase [Myxococcales bacterium]